MIAALESTPSSKKSARKNWRAVFSSPLAMSLLSVFVLVATIEAGFLGVLSIEVQNASKSAANEYELMKCSNLLSNVIQDAQKSFTSADAARKELSPASLEIFTRDVRDTKRKVNLVIKQLDKCGLNTKPAEQLGDRFYHLARVMSTVLTDAQVNQDGKASFRSVLGQTSGLYKGFTIELKRIHAALSSKAEGSNLALMGVSPQILLYISGGMNILLAILLMQMIAKVIINPITKLSKNCQRIMSAEVLASPKRVRNEVNALEESFHKMSVVISENEKRRHSFLEFFQSVQSAALEDVRICFDTLLAESNLQERARKSIQKARTNLSTLMHLLKSMTDALSSHASTDINPVYESCSTNALIADCASQVESLLQKKAIKLQVSGEDYQCQLDSNLVKRVLVNFLSNAIKYSPDASEIRLEISKQSEQIEFRVVDKGPGIAEEDQKKLFKEFSQVAAADGVKRAGTGLGLVIAKQIIEAHGGEVGVNSVVNEGSTFWFRIPEKQNASVAKHAANSPAKEQRFSKPKGSLARVFLCVLLALILCQSIVLFKLNSMFQTEIKRSHTFTNQKEVMLRLEELLAVHLVWKLDVATFLDKQDVLGVADTKPLIQEQRDTIQWILRHISHKGSSYTHMQRTKSAMEKLDKFGDYLRKNADNLNIAILPRLVGQAKVLAGEVEDDLFDVMAEEGSHTERSYSGAASVHAELLSALAFAALVNALLIFGVGAYSLRITDKIRGLQDKATNFAEGNEISSSYLGNDEIAFLDARLCEVAANIREADSQRQKLIAVINHDLRTPLSSIINGLQMILAAGYGEIGQKEKQLTSRAEKELARLLQQINDLLLIEKIDAGLYQLSNEKFELMPVFRAAAESFDASASERNVRFISEVSPDCADICVNGDKSLIEREFAIILSNAVNAAPVGSTIDVAINKSGDKLSVSFRDRGPGIDNELLPHIFDRFRFIDGKPVTGLGLPLAQRLSAIHGGSLEILSSNSGTETRVILPIAN